MKTYMLELHQDKVFCHREVLQIDLRTTPAHTHTHTHIYIHIYIYIYIYIYIQIIRDEECDYDSELKRKNKIVIFRGYLETTRFGEVLKTAQALNRAIGHRFLLLFNCVYERQSVDKISATLIFPYLSSI